MSGSDAAAPHRGTYCRPRIAGGSTACMRLCVSFVLASVAVVVTACSRAPQKDPPEVRRAIAEANARIVSAVHRGDADAVANEFTTDAVMFPAGAEPVRGREAIGRVFHSLIESARVTDLSITSVEVESSGDLAFETGMNSITAGGKTVPGKYVVVWKRDPGGAWKIYRDIGNK